MKLPTRAMCDQQRLRPACAYAQTDQSLCYSLEYSLTVKQLTNHHLKFLSLAGGCTGSPELIFVKMPHCWKSHVAAQMQKQMSLPRKNRNDRPQTYQLSNEEETVSQTVTRQ